MVEEVDLDLDRTPLMSHGGPESPCSFTMNEDQSRRL